MATGLLSPIGILVQQLTNAGQPLSGGLVNTYVAGTTTPVATYTDSTLGVANANPIVLNSAGRLPNSVWVPANTPHKMVLTDANSVTLSTIDQLNGINDPTLVNQFNSALPTASGTANAQVITNTAAITLANGISQWFLPNAANTGATTLNVDSTGVKSLFFNGSALVGGELSVNVPALVKYDGTRYNLLYSIAAPFILSLPTGAGTANAQTVTNATGFKWLSLTSGAEQAYIPNVANTGAVTLAIDGLAATSIFVNGAACVGGELKVNYPAFLKYDGTRFNLLNPYLPAPTNYWSDTGSVNALAIASPIGAYADGQSWLVKVANTTTNGTPTINVNSLGTKNLYYSDGTTQILAGALILNSIYRMTYDSSLNAAAGGVIVESPSDAVGSFTMGINGLSTSPTGTTYYRIPPGGRIAIITLVTLTGTSNINSCSLTGFPTVLQPGGNAGIQSIPLWVENGSTWGIGSLTPANSSTWNLYPGIQGSTFSPSSTKGVNGQTTITVLLTA